MRSLLPAAAVVAAPLLSVTACGEDDTGSPRSGSSAPAQAPATFEAPAGLPGDLLLVEGRLRFLPCGQGAAQPLDDAPEGEGRRAVEELGYGEDRVRAVVVTEAGRLLEVRHAAPEAVGCENLIREGDVQAWGNEPFWNVRVAGDEALWRSPDEPEGIAYGSGEWERPEAGRWRFEARRDGVDGVEFLTLELVEERCRDSMAGSWYPFSARLQHGGRTLEGCALEGTGAVADP